MVTIPKKIPWKQSVERTWSVMVTIPEEYAYAEVTKVTDIESEAKECGLRSGRERLFPLWPILHTPASLSIS